MEFEAKNSAIARGRIPSLNLAQRVMLLHGNDKLNDISLIAFECITFEKKDQLTASLFDMYADLPSFQLLDIIDDLFQTTLYPNSCS